MKKEIKNLNKDINTKKGIFSIINFLKSSMQKGYIAIALQYIFIFALSLLILPGFVFADGRTNEPSHQTLFSNVITSYNDANAVTIADSQGLIVTTGNVGIGTTGPKAKLTIQDTRDRNYPSLFLVQWQDPNSGWAFTPTAWDLGGDAEGLDTIRREGGVDLFVATTITTDGKVGIGTTGPGNKLHVNSGGNDGIRVGGNTFIGGISKEVSDELINFELNYNRLGAQNTARVGGAFTIDTRSPTSNLFHWRVRDTAGVETEPMVLTSTGKVGIGTTVPLAPLHVGGTSATAESFVRLLVGNNDNDNAIQLSVYNDDRKTFVFQNSNGALQIKGTGTLSNLITFHTVSGAERMRIDATGKVGIGTAGPQHQLSVGVTSVDAQTVTVRGYSNSPSNWKGGAAFGYTSAAVIMGQLNGVAQIGGHNGVLNAWANLAINSAGGNVGIGRVPTANKLEVEGTASKTTAGDWLANSDIRIKKDVEDLDNAIEVIKKLRPVKFRYKDEYKINHSSIEDIYYYNFIAQEFKEVFPNFVKEDGSGYLQLDSYVVRPYLVAAVQELAKENQELKARIEALDITGAMHIAPQASPPTTANSGDLYMDSTPAPDELCVYDGTRWQALITGTDANCA